MGEEKNGGKWRFFDGARAPFFGDWRWAPKHKLLIWPLLCQSTFSAPEGKKNGGRHFRERNSSTLADRGRLTTGETPKRADSPTKLAPFLATLRLGLGAPVRELFRAHRSPTSSSIYHTDTASVRFPPCPMGR